MKRAAVLCALAFFAVGCHDSRRDAPVGNVEHEKRDVWQMPDKFPNLAGICFGPDLVLVTTREAAPVVVEDAPQCAEAAS